MPIPTVLDELVYTCLANYELPMMKGLSDLIATQKPGAIFWPQYKTIDESETGRPIGNNALSDKIVATKDRFFCLCLDSPLFTLQGTSAAGESTDPKYKQLFIDIPWEVRGILVDMEEKGAVVVTPILRTVGVNRGDHNIFPDVPVRLHYENKKIIDSNTCRDHVVYREFYQAIVETLTPEETDMFSAKARSRGCSCFDCLMQYSGFIDSIPSGMFKVASPKAPRVKQKNGKVIKIYELGKLGYFEFVDSKGRAIQSAEGGGK